MLCFATIGDVSEGVTGVVTVVLAGLAWRSARSGENSAVAASKSARLAELQLQEAQRPLLVPEAPWPDGVEFTLPVRNIGVGPAIRVYGRAQARNLPPSVIGRFAHHVLPGVSAGDEVSLRFSVDLADLLSVKVTYVDATDRAYTTDAMWDRLRRSFTHVTVEEGDSVRVPVSITITSPAGPPQRDGWWKRARARVRRS